MGIRNKNKFANLALLLALGLAGCSSASNDSATSGGAGTAPAGEPVEGGILEVAYSADPDTLDWMYTGASATRDIGWHIFEPLFALDTDYKVRPMIAAAHEVSEDQLVHTITIRDGLEFHDGTALTSEDAAASIDRWRKISSVGKIADQKIASVEAIDDLTVEITLTEEYAPLLADLAAPKSALMVIPAEIAEAAGEQPMNTDQLIGTGPYQFEKWERGSQIVLTRFENYAARDEEWGGLAGQKTAHLEQINFTIVKDPQSMINGVKTDLYDYAQSIPPDLHDVVEANPTIDPVNYINGYSVITPDQSEPPFNDLKARQALSYALDKETIAKAAYGNEDFYELDGALFSPKQAELYTDEGTDQYLTYDPEKAEKLLAESDYDGEPIKIMYANNYDDYARIAEIAKQQLEAIGFTVELVPYEWATYLEKWGDPGNWDLVAIGWSTRFSPNELGMLSQDSNSSGWYNSERWTGLIDQWSTDKSTEEQKATLAEMNQTIYDELPFVKIANETTLDIKSSSLVEYDSWVGPRFWNTWLSE